MHATYKSSAYPPGSIVVWYILQGTIRSAIECTVYDQICIWSYVFAHCKMCNAEFT